MSAAEALRSRLKEAVSRRREELIELTAALVREPSLNGAEEGAQALIAERLAALGFELPARRDRPAAGRTELDLGLPAGKL